MQLPTGSDAFEHKTAVSVAEDVVHANDLRFRNNEGASCTLYSAVELIEIVGFDRG
jgi:hypothetical protein